MKKYLYIILLFITLNNFAQMSFGTTTPHPAAILDLTSSTKGFLPPRMNNVQKLSILTPPSGLMIWCTDCGTNGLLQVYNGSSWTDLSGLFTPTSTSNGTAVVSSYSCTSASSGIFKAGTPVSQVTQTITATVTFVGTYSISATANGVTYFGSGTFTGIGAQNIVLTAFGMPIYEGNTTFTLNTSPSCSFVKTVQN